MSWYAPAGSGSHRPGAAALALAVVISISACGGGAATTADAASTATSNPAVDPTPAAPTAAEPAAPTAEQTEAGGQDAAFECSLDAFTSCGGSATLTFGGEPFVFDFFACFTGDDAARAFGHDGTRFAALGQRSGSGGPDTVGIGIVEHGAIDTHELVYVPSGEPNTEWHRDSDSQRITVQGDHVTFDGDLVEAVGGTLTGQQVAASLDATCGA